MPPLTQIPKKWWIVPALMLALLIVFSLIPLPKANSSNCIAVNGKLTEVKKGTGPGDIVLKILGDNGYYYINRGLDYGIKLDELTEQLVNNDATVYYIRHWSLLNINGRTRHVARIETGGKVIYNEWAED